jgi:hypothetical protein
LLSETVLLVASEVRAFGLFGEHRHQQFGYRLRNQSSHVEPTDEYVEVPEGTQYRQPHAEQPHHGTPDSCAEGTQEHPDREERRDEHRPTGDRKALGPLAEGSLIGSHGATTAGRGEGHQGLLERSNARTLARFARSRFVVRLSSSDRATGYPSVPFEVSDRRHRLAFGVGGPALVSVRYPPGGRLQPTNGTRGAFGDTPGRTLPIPMLPQSHRAVPERGWSAWRSWAGEPTVCQGQLV